ncbi:low temperature requirement protein A [Paenibacillus sp. JX-17]|uniref:Low temperature requirement protein A n=1 Tax=Paenibacillus lacisoli TaxID=3064525 RepID=A0ABT9CAJ4_9BACL|nr:low temperature requirement protein A [Paenibacillus sp. JX-17]MDO7906262.1 low temperature requirement protein A [Paenibacillus sp. JX-17]
MELFYDLIYVAAVSMATHILAEAHGGHISWDAIIKYPLIFIPLWWAWTGFTVYVNRFGQDNTTERIVYFVQMVFVILMAAHINIDFEAHYLFFMLGYVGIRLSTVFMYARIWRVRDGVSRQVARYLCISFLIGSFISFSSVLFPGMAKFYVLYLGIFLDILLPLIGRHQLRKLPVHHHHLMERYGLATIILLGELILVMVDTIRDHSITVESGIVLLLGFLIAVAIWWHYFESSEAAAQEERTSSGQSIIYGHLFTFMSLGITSNVVRYAFNRELELPGFAWLALAGLGLYVVSVLVIFHPLKKNAARGTYRLLGYHLAVLGLAAVVLLLLPSIIAVYIACTIFFVGYALVSLKTRKGGRNSTYTKKQKIHHRTGV